ncbi:pyroglutamylated RF-amide peptide receptor-like [Phycodurus eques]|uniref:pyroglutamylated RF-amide peptide receptor-like n=1 Tax=Phycodurus eques TaxID=693459 RepID=UPI002ACEB659|nr:pyroglutamylated RF-amide peptide receptor-like [Phycodurus eques]
MPEKEAEASAIAANKKRAVKTMVIVVLLFTVCWSPFHMIFEYYDSENKYDDATLNTIVAVVRAVGLLNSFDDAVVYAFTNGNFKKSCVSALSKRTRRPARAQTREAFSESESDSGDGSKRRAADRGGEVGKSSPSFKPSSPQTATLAEDPTHSIRLGQGSKPFETLADLDCIEYK